MKLIQFSDAEHNIEYENYIKAMNNIKNSQEKNKDFYDEVIEPQIISFLKENKAELIKLNNVEIILVKMSLLMMIKNNLNWLKIVPKTELTLMKVKKNF